MPKTPSPKEALAAALLAAQVHDVAVLADLQAALKAADDKIAEAKALAEQLANDTVSNRVGAFSISSVIRTAATQLARAQAVVKAGAVAAEEAAGGAAAQGEG